MDRTFDIYYQVDDPKNFPAGVIRNVSLYNYVKIKHYNYFAYNFLKNYFENNNVFVNVDSIKKLWVSTDDVDYRLVFDTDYPEVHQNNNYI